MEEINKKNKKYKSKTELIAEWNRTMELLKGANKESNKNTQKVQKRTSSSSMTFSD